MLKDILLHARVSLTLTVLTVGAVLYLLGVDAVVVLLTLTLIEITFSFENAIINAKILGTLSDMWRRAFLTVGIIIAVIGMRLVFPIVLIMLTTGLTFTTTVDLALYHPGEYAARVAAAHPAISAFGGTFLLLLALTFFMSNNHGRMWLGLIEKPLRRFRTTWASVVVCGAVLAVVALACADYRSGTVLLWGIVAIATFLVIRFLTSAVPRLSERSQPSKKRITGMAALFTFVYLEILDASFSLDGVLGAFAVTNNVLLVAAGLGVGAFWVRSLTVYMVKRRALRSFTFIEHGAHYAIVLLALSLYGSLFVNIPSSVVGISGLIVIGASVAASRMSPHRTRIRDK